MANSYMLDGRKLRRIDFGAEGEFQIIQNVSTLLATPIGSVVLDRRFGVDMSFLDNPTPMARAKFQQSVVAAIRKYEPRARITKVGFRETKDGILAGRMIPVVSVEVTA